MTDKIPKASNTREKFTTTLSKEHKRRLSILTAIEGLDGNNAWIEKQIDIKWEQLKGEL